MIKGFKDFILRGNAVDLAVAVIIGGAFNSIVNSLVKDLLTPFIAAIGGKPDFSHIYLILNSSKITVGDFLNNLVSFLIISTVVYFFIVVPMNKLIGRNKPKEPRDKVCPECLSKIPVKAIRCKYCTSVVG